MKTFIYLLIIAGTCFSSCNEIKNNIEYTSHIIDSVKIREANLNLKGSKDLFQNYRIKFGVAIPEYYSVKDSLPIDLNGDKIIDTLVLLSPIFLEDVNYLEDAPFDSVSRILIEVLNNGKGSKIRNTYDNLTSNSGGVLSKYNGLNSSSGGFEIHHQSGSRYSWSYTCEFSVNDQDSIFLERLVKSCAIDGISREIEYKFDRKSVGGLNINDTIVNNCNCDDTWAELEKKIK